MAVINIGAPAGGMSSGVRAFVRYALYQGHSVLGIRDGIDGLLEDRVCVTWDKWLCSSKNTHAWPVRLQWRTHTHALTHSHTHARTHTHKIQTISQWTVSQSCAVAFWRTTGQSNSAYKRMAATKASKVWFAYSHNCTLANGVVFSSFCLKGERQTGRKWNVVLSFKVSIVSWQEVEYWAFAGGSKLGTTRYSLINFLNKLCSVTSK